MHGNRKFQQAGSFLVFGILLSTFACSGGSSSAPKAEQDYQAPDGGASQAQGWQTISIVANFADTKLDSFGHFDTSRNACGHEAYGNLDMASWNRITDLANQALKTPALDEHDEICMDRPDGNKMDGTVDLVLEIPTTNSQTPNLYTESSAAASNSAPTDDSHAVNVEARPSTHPIPSISFDPEPTHPIEPTHPVEPTHAAPTPTPTTRPSSSPSPIPSPSPSVAPKRSLYETKGAQICTTIKDPQVAQALLQKIGQLVDAADKTDCANGWGH